jgi:DoxX-like protein
MATHVENLTTPARSTVRLRTVAYWVVSAPVLVETAVGIQWDLARIPYVLEVLDRLGFPPYFATILGISKVLALVALLLPRTPRLKEWAYAGLVFVYVGAAACHVAVGDTAQAVLTPLVLAAITLASWALRPASRRDPAPLPAAWRVRLGHRAGARRPEPSDS